MDHLAAKETFPSEAGADQNRPKRRINIGLTFPMWPEKQLKMNATVFILNLCLLNV